MGVLTVRQAGDTVSEDWFRMDVDYAENPKVSALSDSAFRFHTAALCLCARNLTDGHISAKAVKVLALMLDKRPLPRTKELVASKLWKHDLEGDGFWINDYLKYQQSAASAKARSDAGRIAARTRWDKKHAESNANGNADRIATGNAHDVTELQEKNHRAVPPKEDAQPSTLISIGETIDRSLKEAS